MINQLKTYGLIFVAGIVTAFVLGTCTAEKNYFKTFQKYQTEVVKPTIAFNDSLKKENIQLKFVEDSLKKKDEQQTVKIATLSGEIKHIAERNRRLSDSLFSGSIADTCLPLARLVQGLQLELNKTNEKVAELEKRDTTRLNTITNLTQQNFNLTIANDTLTRTILNWPKPEPPRKLFRFLEVSPTTAFLTGVVVTSAAALYIDKQRDDK